MKAAHKMLLLVLISAGLIAGMLSARVPRAYACSCVTQEVSEEENIHQKFERADAVFAGKALNSSDPETDTDELSIRFQVLKVWKGPVSPILTVNNDPSTCGLSIVEGSEYLVYAYGGQNHLKIGLCTGTTLLRDTDLDLEVLGTGIVPTDEPGPNLPVPFDPTIGVVLLAVIALLVLALFIVIRRGGKA
jgi:hypothetical protein